MHPGVFVSGLDLNLKSYATYGAPIRPGDSVPKTFDLCSASFGIPRGAMYPTGSIGSCCM